ncbi:c-type cytochrome [Marinicaulis aureus]|uniref:C-type cytochrome n=1 Tax=Hyphococcus aureus TaxID=2666033 RepID=A0ABW1KVL6_9PROT
MKKQLLSAACLCFLMAACGNKTEETATSSETQTPAMAKADQEVMPVTSQAPAGSGKALFERSCAMCHRDMGMGTGLLARRVDVAKLEDRSDLNADYIIQAARIGIGNMPVITRGEVSDEELQAIADYLTSE